MKPLKILLGPVLIIATLCCMLGFLFIAHNLRQHSPQLPTTNSTAQPAKAEVKKAETTYSLPVRLKIPKINVDAPVEQMGLTPQGDMQAPDGPSNVGWYKLGSHPGNKGSAVIAGHYGRWKNGQESVFEKLHTLQKGDDVKVEDEKGATVDFIVRDLRTYSPDQTAPDVFEVNDDKAHLNLITCQGVWDDSQKTYSQRLVVFTDKK
jgi:sortase A